MQKRSLYFTVIIISLIGLGIYTWQYFAYGKKDILPGEKITLEKELSDTKKESVEIVIEEVVHGLQVPWSMVFTSPERILITERPGRIRLIVNEVLTEKPLYEFPEVSQSGEEGLMGLALDPLYPENKQVYVSLAYETGGIMKVKVMRFVDTGEALVSPIVLLDDIPAAKYHAGSRLVFGPDKKLYITTGDATDKEIAQDMESLGGKILRMNTDGSVPEDNPFPGSLIYSYGHRNPQGVAWNTKNNELYATEHGPSLFDGPAGGDEINHIVAGKNYGWPLVSHENKRVGTESPLLLFTPAVAPGGATFYQGLKIPQFTGTFFFSALKGEGIFQVRFDRENPEKVQSYEKLSGIDFGRIRDVVEGPDEALYFLTSNRDGRGNPDKTDDKIYRIRAK